MLAEKAVENGARQKTGPETQSKINKMVGICDVACFPKCQSIYDQIIIQDHIQEKENSKTMLKKERSVFVLPLQTVTPFLVSELENLIHCAF